MTQDQKSNYIIDRLMKYVQETGYPKTPIELAEDMEVDTLQNELNETIGLIGYTVVKSTHLGKVGTVHLVYIDLPFRKNFNDTMLIVGNYMKGLDTEVTEFFTDSRSSKWFEEKIGSKPITHIHLLETERFIEKIKELRNES